jgi:hypothetical protein
MNIAIIVSAGAERFWVSHFVAGAMSGVGMFSVAGRRVKLRAPRDTTQ